MIVLKNISKYYHSENQVTPGVQRVNLTFRCGEFVAIAGESGSGKTTLLNVSSGLDTYEDGEMLVNGEPTSGYDEAVNPAEPSEEPEASSRKPLRGLTKSFLKMEFHSQKAKLLSLFLILLVTAGSMFIFPGGILTNLDDTGARKYDDSVFYNGDNKRIIVRHTDGSMITDEDMAYLRTVKQVEYVDKYSAVNDMYYFCQEGEDYRKTFVVGAVMTRDWE